MFMSFTKPHAPYDPPEPYHTMYDPRKVPMPLPGSETSNRTPTKHQEDIERGWSLLSPEAHRAVRAHYYGLISFKDKQIGRALDYLEQNGLDKNTIIVYAADHGDMIGDFGLFAKSCFYRGSVNVPMLVGYPEKIQPSQVNGFEEFYDLENDPQEMENRINDPNYADSIQELRTEMESWARENGDMSLLNENGHLKEDAQPTFLEDAEFSRRAIGISLY